MILISQVRNKKCTCVNPYFIRCYTKTCAFYLILFLKSNIKRGDFIKRFNFWLPIELFNHIKIEAKKYNVSITKLMITLLEIGLEKFMKYGRNDINENEYK